MLPSRFFCYYQTDTEDSREITQAGLTFSIKYATFSCVKGCDEDMPFRKDSQREASWCEGFVTLPNRIPLLSCQPEMADRVRPLKRQ